LSTVFERCVSIFFSLDCLLFVPRLLRCVQTFELRFDFLFPACLFIFCFSMFLPFFNFLLVCPILSVKDPTIVNGGDSERYSAPRTRCAAMRQRPRTRFCHASKRLVQTLLGQTYILERLFPAQVREQPAISARAATGCHFIPRSDWWSSLEHISVTRTLVTLACPFSTDISFVSYGHVNSYR